MAETQTRTAGGEKGEPHPSGDERFKMLDARLKRQPSQFVALIEVLDTAR
jgi:hypothetical protein